MQAIAGQKVLKTPKHVSREQGGGVGNSDLKTKGEKTSVLPSHQAIRDEGRYSEQLGNTQQQQHAPKIILRKIPNAEKPTILPMRRPLPLPPPPPPTMLPVPVVVLYVDVGWYQARVVAVAIVRTTIKLVFVVTVSTTKGVALQVEQPVVTA